MAEQPTTAFLVVLTPGATDNDASVIRTMLRRDPAVASVNPVGANPAQEVASQRAKADLREEILPIWAEASLAVKGILEATTEEFAAAVAPGRETPIDMHAEAAKIQRPHVVPPPPDLPSQRQSPRQQREVPRNPVGSWQALR